jgi:hypothetical protein
MSSHLPPEIEVNAGRHSRVACPVVFTPERLPVERCVALVSEDGGVCPVQIMSDGSAAFILDHAEPFRNRRYHLESAPDEALPSGMRIIDNDDQVLSVLEDGALRCEYRFSPDYARPFFFPVNDPSGRCVTRSYPMQIVPHETSDHPHHKSLWIAHGDVNGVDNWSEEEGHGRTCHNSIHAIEEGPVVARFSTTSTWTDADNSPLLSQYLTASFWRGTKTTAMMDFDIRLTADCRTEDLVFGDTKEGGTLSVRVASALDATRGGLITNVYGGKDEAECWGKHSHWCSYAGSIDHQPCGIAIFDHPDSFRSPTTWHVRDYGLMTANPFGYSAFTHGRVDGRYLLPAGNSMLFRYRIITPADPDFNAHCSSHYLNYAFPPRVRHLR